MAAQPKLDQQWNHLTRHYCHRRHHLRRHQTMAQFEPLPTPTVSQILAKIFFVNIIDIISRKLEIFPVERQDAIFDLQYII